MITTWDVFVMLFDEDGSESIERICKTCSRKPISFSYNCLRDTCQTESCCSLILDSLICDTWVKHTILAMCRWNTLGQGRCCLQTTRWNYGRVSSITVANTLYNGSKIDHLVQYMRCTVLQSNVGMNHAMMVTARIMICMHRGLCEYHLTSGISSVG